WAIAVEYLESAPSQKGKTPSIDYRDILNEADFGVFRRLRELRKQLAEAEGKPVYTIFTNAQLAEMAKRRTGTKAQLHEIEGVGEAKVEKYGEQFLKALKEAPDETNG
ncbi:MAG: HRDC domain-containing protein, partial [Planctomycetota bacterium]|nr:HRDC domain-containing protein [Planctomycetota bacterium]